MPKNKVIYWGVMVTVGSALLWVGAVFLSKIKDMLPFFVLGGVAIIVAGVALELRAKKGNGDASPPVS